MCAGFSSDSVKQSLGDYRSIGERADRGVLSLFPSFNYWFDGVSVKRQDEVLRCLACMYAIGVGGEVSVRDLSKSLGLSRSTVARSLALLSRLSFVTVLKSSKMFSFVPTAKGVIVLMAFKEFQALNTVKPLLCSPLLKNNSLAFAQLVIGYSVAKKEDILFSTLVCYAQKGGNLEALESDASAEALLSLYIAESKTAAVSLPNYLGVFKEFTTAGFQQVLQILLVSLKPAVEDYNWLVEFFGEVIEFYYNPVRLAYVNLLSESPKLKGGLEGFKRSQEQQIHKEGSTMEVTFNVPSANVQKFMTMPTHLRAVATRLILEPLQFANRELAALFWPT